MLLKQFISMVFTCPLLSGCKISSPFRENNNLVYPFPFRIFMPLANLLFIHIQSQFPIPRKISCPDIYPLTRPPRRQLALGRGESLSQDLFGFLLHQPFTALPTLFLQEVQIGTFPSVRMRPEEISHTTLVLQRAQDNITIYPNQITKLPWEL